MNAALRASRTAIGGASAPLLALGALLAWDAGGGDIAAARLFGGPGGFAARDAWWASTLLHDGGRWAAWIVLAALVVAAVRAPRTVADRAVSAPSAGERWRWIAVTLVCIVAVPALKRFSTTSCPWDLAEFGGTAFHLSHWAFGRVDGGAGHCFPSGHAVAAFAFVGQYFLWRDHDRRHARRRLAAVLAAGAVFGTLQLARGAHFPSHTLWSGWLCWAIAAAAAAWWRPARAHVAPSLPA